VQFVRCSGFCTGLNIHAHAAVAARGDSELNARYTSGAGDLFAQVIRERLRNSTPFSGVSTAARINPTTSASLWTTFPFTLSGPKCLWMLALAAQFRGTWHCPLYWCVLGSWNLK
jgi:hypothetical protein